MTISYIFYTLDSPQTEKIETTGFCIYYSATIRKQNGDISWTDNIDQHDKLNHDDVTKYWGPSWMEELITKFCF